MPVRSSAPRLAGFSVRPLAHAIVPEQEYSLAAEWNSVCIDRHSRQRVTKESKPFIGNDTFYVTRMEMLFFFFFARLKEQIAVPT